MLKGKLAEFNSENAFLRYAKGLDDQLKGWREPSLKKALSIGKEKHLEAFYVPYRFKLGLSTRVLLLGITPGRDQAWSALKAHTLDESLRSKASFSSGSSGANRVLVGMLDQIGLPEALGLETSRELFDSRAKLCSMTSVARYPVMFKGKNYNGHQVKITNSELIKRQAELFLLPKLKRFKGKLLIIPFGDAVSDFLKAYQFIDEKHEVLHGFPHFSGGNTHRVRKFKEVNLRLKRQIKAHFREC